MKQQPKIINIDGLTFEVHRLSAIKANGLAQKLSLVETSEDAFEQAQAIALLAVFFVEGEIKRPVMNDKKKIDLDWLNAKPAMVMRLVQESIDFSLADFMKPPQRDSATAAQTIEATPE